MKDILKEIRGVFKPPTKKYYFGLFKYGTPYFKPWNYVPTIIGFRRKGKYSYHRVDKKHILINNDDFYLYWGYPIKIHNGDLGWKDKYNTPRFEWNPIWTLNLFGLQFAILYVPPCKDWDNYWEMILWWLKYCDKDLKKAEQTWGWVDYTTKKSTWNKENVLL